MFVHSEAEINSWCDPGHDGASEWTRSQGVLGDRHGLRAVELIRSKLEHPYQVSWGDQFPDFFFFFPFFVIVVEYT